MKIKGTEIPTVCFSDINRGGVFQDTNDGVFFIKGASSNATDLCNGIVTKFAGTHKVVAKKDAVLFVDETKLTGWKNHFGYFEQLSALTNKVERLERSIKILNNHTGTPEDPEDSEE